MKTFQALLFVTLCNGLLFSQTKNLNVDFSSSNGNIKKLTSVNNGPLSLIVGTAEYCYKQIGVEMIRTHDYHGPFDYYGYTDFYNIFNQSFDYSFQSNNPLAYNWADTDEKIGEIINPGFKPFFRLGISFPAQGNPPLTPIPKDQDGINFHTFAGICKRTAMHYTANWNNGFSYNIPYWEVWNEPNNGASWIIDSVQTYYRMYKQVTDSMKNFNPNIKVGGPATAKNAFYSGGDFFSLNQDYISNFFQYCQTNNVPLDFYSFHTYDRKNPYHIKQLADTISHFLIQSGFDGTELIVSELNVNTGGFLNSGKACSHLASTLISASDSKISKLLWYRGVDLNPLCNSDNGTNADLQLNGYAYQFFNEMYDSTNIRLTTSGSEFVLDRINDSLNNLMLISGKNTSGDLLKIMVSNYESSHQNIDVNVSNLPWQNSDLIEVSVQKITDNGYETTSSTINGAGNLTVNLTNVIDASTYLITLRKNSINTINLLSSSSNFSIFPNPANSDFTVHFKESVSETEINLLDQYGKSIKLIKNFNGNELSIQHENLSSGIYFLQIKTQNGFSERQKISIID